MMVRPRATRERGAPRAGAPDPSERGDGMCDAAPAAQPTSVRPGEGPLWGPRGGWARGATIEPLDWRTSRPWVRGSAGALSAACTVSTESSARRSRSHPSRRLTSYGGAALRAEQRAPPGARRQCLRLRAGRSPAPLPAGSSSASAVSTAAATAGVTPCVLYASSTNALKPFTVAASPRR